MTRFARAHQKLEHGPSSWKELSQGVKGEGHTHKKKKSKGGGSNQNNQKSSNPQQTDPNQEALGVRKVSNKTVFKTQNRRTKDIEQRKKRRARKKVCLKCREPGHLLADCPNKNEIDGDKCFKCGQADHKSSECKAKVGKDEYPFAQCYICKEEGHLASKCPDNPKGLYPHGGGCKFCGSVEHFRKDCPERDCNKQKALADKKASRFTMVRPGESLDAVQDSEGEDDEESASLVPAVKKKKKVVTF